MGWKQDHSDRQRYEAESSTGTTRMGRQEDPRPSSCTTNSMRKRKDDFTISKSTQGEKEATDSAPSRWPMYHLYSNFMTTLYSVTTSKEPYSFDHIMSHHDFTTTHSQQLLVATESYPKIIFITPRLPSFLPSTQKQSQH
jgi:hypothetical protein